MLWSHMDHMITAPSLEVGVEYVRQALGVSPQVGGEHPRMGTHNCLLKLGEKFFLEVISINPNAPQPNRPRLLGHSDVKTTMIYTHCVPSRTVKEAKSPLDFLLPP